MNWAAIVNLVLSAIGVGVTAAIAAHTAGSDWTAAITAGATAAGGAFVNHLRINPLTGGT